MEWSREAIEAINKVPFFVRRKVKAKVEKEASRNGAKVVTIEHVRACKRRFLNKMEDEVKGYQLETCFGPSGCPNRAVQADNLSEELETILIKKGLKDFLKEKVSSPLKFHHEFRVVIADCPNACSRPQIVDVGLIAASVPAITEEPCSECNACVEVCKEDAIILSQGRPVISETQCLFCGVCISSCPTGTLKEAKSGYRVLVGENWGGIPGLQKTWE